MKTVAFQTLGCKVNYYESEALKGLFRRAGYIIVGFYNKADVYIINTCTVTHLSDRKSRQMIRRAHRQNPNAVIVVTGCYAQVSASEIEDILGVDIIIGTFGREQLPEMVKKIQQQAIETPLNLVHNYPPKISFEKIPWAPDQSRTRAFLKIQEGCDQYCSFCIIPYARGPVRSRTLKNVQQEVSCIANSGYKEIVLTGVHLGLYGRDLEQNVTLADLLEELDHIQGIKRIRLSSIEPTDFNPALIEAISNSHRVCAHLHIPLQSGDDYILKRMNRPYILADYKKLVEKLRNLIPELAISTDVIVGFPGEKESNFKNTYNFIKDTGFSRLHVFKYSPRKGTPAADYPDQVSPPIKEKRSHQLIQLGKELEARFAVRFTGRHVAILLEKPVDDMIEGLTEHYLRARIKNTTRRTGQMINVQLKEWKGDYFSAITVSEKYKI